MARQFCGEDLALGEQAPRLTCLPARLALICLLSLEIPPSPLQHPSGCGCTGTAPTGKGIKGQRAGRVGEDINKDQKKSPSSEIKLWEMNDILCAHVYPNPPTDIAWEGWICPTGMTEATPHHFRVSHDVSQQWDQPGMLQLTCLTSREVQTHGHLASY